MFTKVVSKRLLAITQPSLIKKLSLALTNTKGTNNLKASSSMPFVSSSNLLKYRFSSASSHPQSSKIPNVHRLRKQAQQIKQKQGQKSQKYIKLLHQLTIVLVNKDFYDEALEAAQKVVSLYEEIYQSSEKDLVNEASKLLYYRALQGLYKVKQDINKVIQVSLIILNTCQLIMVKNDKIAPMIVDQYLQLGYSYSQIGQFDKSIQMLQNSINLAQKSSSDPKNVEKIIESRNVIAQIIFNKKNMPQESIKLLQQNLSQIQKAYNDKFNMHLVSECIINLTLIYHSRLTNLSVEHISAYLDMIHLYIKQVCLHYLNNDLDLERLLNFYRNLAQLYERVKDFKKAIDCYRFQRDYLPETDINALCLCYQNQANIYVKMNKKQKAIEKLTRSYLFREQIDEKLRDKKRKNQQEVLQFKENHQKILKDCDQISKLYQQTKDAKNSQIWALKHQAFINL